jgi:hypothetical protein
MTHPTLPAPDPNERRADELKPGDWVAGLIEGGLGEPPWRDAEILAAFPYTDSVDNARVLLVAQAADSTSPETARRLADHQVRLLTAVEREAMRQQAERARRIADIRAFADFLEQHPWAPIEGSLSSQWSPDPQGDLWNSGAEGLAQVREFAGRMGAEVVQGEDRTSAIRRFGWVEYRLIAWHKGGRPAEPEAVKPLISDETIAEVAAMEERDRAAGGPPWEAPGHPENFQPGSWHRGQLDPTGLTYSREQDDPTPVSPARGGPVHTGGVVAGGQLVDETPAEVPTLTVAGLTAAADESRGQLAGTTPVVTYFSFGYGQTDPDTGKSLLNHYVTVVAPTYDECRTAMFASRFGRAWSFDYLAGRASTTRAVSEWTEHEVIIAPGVDPGRAEVALKAAAALLVAEPPVHLEVAGAKTMCGLPIMDLPSGEPWTNDHTAVTCKACIDEVPF